MKYTLDTGRTINIPDADIARLQKSLKISEAEAIQTWLVDEEYISDETVDELTEKAKKNRITATVHKAKAEDSAKKERKPREKKENPLKKAIIDALFKGLEQNLAENAEIHITNDEKYIDLHVNGLEFTINLVQHRPKK
jgi:FKBP-type peptidyl-prolyl cis-trans isomerase